MEKILIFGVNGMLGNYVYNLLKNKYEISGVSRKDFNIEEKNWSKLEILIKDFNIIINCAGIIPQKSKDLKNSIIVNTLFPLKLSELCFKSNIKLIHITTDCVFDGKIGKYNEKRIHNSEDIYGITKSLGENNNCTIIRTSIIGEERDNKNKKSLLEWVKSNKNKEINGYNNHYWNGITCLKLAEIIEEIIVKNLFWKGVRHIFSPSIISKYELCNYINEIYDLKIEIKFKNSDIYCDRSLTSIYEKLFYIEDIKEQIIKIKYLSV